MVSGASWQNRIGYPRRLALRRRRQGRHRLVGERLHTGALHGPQARAPGQLVYQYLNLDDAHDPVSDIAHRAPDALHGPIGLRLSADSLPWLLRPYLKANIWQDFAGSDRTIYDGVHEIVNRHRSTTLELGGGFIASIAPNVGLWASADWTTDIAGTEQSARSVRGTAGLRVVW